MVAKDDYIIVLDFLPHGKSTDRKSEPVAQGIGDKFLNLLEITVKEGVSVEHKDRVYVGDDKRDQVQYIRGRIKYEDLTNYSKNVIKDVVTELVTNNQKRFVNFFNKAGPVTTRLHSLELLPGVGKKHMWEIIRERRSKPFEDFADLHKRVPMLPDPKNMVIKRVIEDLEEKDRYKLFVSNNTL